MILLTKDPLHEGCLVAQNTYLFSGKCHCCERREGAKTHFHCALFNGIRYRKSEKFQNRMMESKTMYDKMV